MNFFRKHQKKLFIVIAVMTIASFTFFGTYGTVNQREIVDKEIGKALNGSAITDREVHGMIRFLTLPGSEILRDDLMASGLTALLAEKHFGEIRSEFEEKLDRAKRYSPYVHPQAPFLSALQVWNRFIPQLSQHLALVRAGDLSPQTFSHYCQLYLDQHAFPPEIVSRILQYHQQQYSWVTPDRELADPRRIALFNAQSFEEWFGPQFTEVLGKFIFNTAVIAEKKGYQVSTNEARANLLQTCLEAVRNLYSDKQVTYADASEFFRLQLQMSGMDESQALKVWKKVMLVHRLFNDVGQSVLVDSLSYQQFAAFSDEKATVEVYQLPETLRLGDFQSLLKLHYYLDAVSPKTKHNLKELPRQFYSPQEVEKKTPELVISRFDVEVAKVSKEEIGSRLSLKETWDFEVSDAGWEKIKIEYPILDKGDNRLQILDSLEPNLRLKIDRLARSILIDQHPEWIEEALQSVKPERTSVAIRSKGSVAPFSEIEETATLRKFLDAAPIGVPAPLFTPDEQTYYLITVWGKPAKKEIMTLKEAMEGNWIGQLVDRKLETAYPDIRKKDPDSYKRENGSWKPFAEVRDSIGAYVYSDYIKNLADQSLNQFASERLVDLMEGARKSIESQGETSPYLAITGDPLVDQWKLVSQVKEIKRSEKTPLSKTEMFTGDDGKWSSVVVPHSGDLAFFKLMKRESAPITEQDRLAYGQRLLGTDAKRLLMLQILDQIDECTLKL